MDLRGRDLLTLLDYTKEEIKYLLIVARSFKQMKKEKIPHNYLKGKNIVLLFEKDSTRTRCAFEVAGFDLGMSVTYLGSSGSQMGHKETIADTARVLTRMYDGIEYRGFAQKTVEELAKYATVPVWNGLTDDYHPTQVLADLMTVEEEFGSLTGRTLVFLGDGRNNMANSLMIICSKIGVNFTICAPNDLYPNEDLIAKCEGFAKESGAVLTFTEDVMEGTKNADVLYTDVWVSMGEPEELWETRISKLLPYQVNKKVMDNASPNAIFLHCLPSFHNEHTSIGKKIKEKYGISEMEASDEVFESSQSRVFEEAENRLHTIKAVIYETLK